MWRQPPIWEPKGTKFRPYSITTLIFFISGSSSDGWSEDAREKD
jgi:hypothetical protein